MSVSIYAAVMEDYKGSPCCSPVIPFENWVAETLAPDADERVERGESAFIKNPDYVENAGMDLSTANARLLFRKLGLPLNDEGFLTIAIDDAQKAVMRSLNGEAANYTEEDQVMTGTLGATIYAIGVREGQMRNYLTRLSTLISEGRKLGATHLACG